MSKAAVVILNWNGKDFLQKFLPSIVLHTPAMAEIIIADNASTDDSVSFLKHHYPQLRIIKNAVNGGFAKGYNDALKQVDAEYYVLLNSDVEVTKGWMDNIIARMDADPIVAACQPKIKSFANRNLFEYAGAAGGFIDKFGYPFCRGRIFNTFEDDLGQYEESCEILWATGACLFIRSEIYHNAGGLDEDFFAHMEEIDLCWRIKNLGYRVLYCSESTVYHVGGGTLSKISPKKTFLNFRNNLILLCKNHASRFFWMKMLLRMKLDGLAGFKFLISGDVQHFFAVIHAHLSFYATFRKTLRKRKTIAAGIKHYTTTAIYRKSIVMDYFIRGKRKFSQLDPEKFY